VILSYHKSADIDGAPAQGDGNTDDTAAIKATLAAVSSFNSVWQSGIYIPLLVRWM
jgi:hypothetical protein